MKQKNLAIFAILVLFFSLITPSFSISSGELVVYLKNTKGDRISAYGTVLYVYDPVSSKLIEQVEPAKGNQHFTVNLLKNNQYKIEAYVHGIYAATDYVNISSDSQRIDLILPNTGGIKFHVVYNDKSTPVTGATVVLKTPAKKQIRNEPTDMDGNTLRMWIAPTIQSEDYYEVEVRLSDNITFSEKPILLLPSAQVDHKIVTPWKPVVDSLITVTVYKNEYQKLQQSKELYVASLHKDGNKLQESVINSRGEAYFSNLLVGDYDLKITGPSQKEQWNKGTISITGEKTNFKIFAYELSPDYRKTPQITQETHFVDSETLMYSCKCVAFRFDDVQDYWLNDIQMKIIDTFEKKLTPVTIGVIGGKIGNDTKLVSHIDEALLSNEIEIANHGWMHEDFTKYDKEEQDALLKKTNKKISDLFGVTPRVFIPPLNNFNDDTIEILKENKFTHYSSEFDYSFPPFPLTNQQLYNFPEGAFTGDLNIQRTLFVGVSHIITLNQIHQSLDKYGFAVVTIHPQEFSVIRDGTYTNQVNMIQIGELEKLIDKLHKEKLQIVPLGKINQYSEPLIPDWIRSNVKQWSKEPSSDSKFVDEIKFLIKNGMISTEYEEITNMVIPVWFKNNMDWWTSKQISDDDFLSGIQFLLNQKIIKV